MLPVAPVLYRARATACVSRKVLVQRTQDIHWLMLLQYINNVKLFVLNVILNFSVKIVIS